MFLGDFSTQMATLRYQPSFHGLILVINFEYSMNNRPQDIVHVGFKKPKLSTPHRNICILLEFKKKHVLDQSDCPSWLKNTLSF